MKVQKYITALLGVFVVSASLNALAAPGCVDLSGDWAGSCLSSPGKTRQEQTLIAQRGCRAITVDGRFFIFGQVIETHVPSGNYNVTYEKFAFNPTGTELQYDYVGMYKESRSNNSPVTMSVKTNYAMRNGGLLRTMTDNMTGFSETCTFSQH